MTQYDQLKDKTIICCDCSKSFIHSASEQAYFISKGLHEPKRCHSCRKARREAIVPRGLFDG